MKVFEVVTEHPHGQSTEIIRTVQYVTCYDDNIKTVMESFVNHCFEYEKQLMGVTEVLTVTEQIEKPE